MEAFFSKVHIFDFIFFRIFFRVIFSQKKSKMDKNGHKKGKKALIEKNLHYGVDTTYMYAVLNF